jgi:hypothetical protein
VCVCVCVYFVCACVCVCVCILCVHVPVSAVTYAAHRLSDDRIRPKCSIEDAASDAQRTCKIFACVARQGLIGVLF